MNNEKMDDNSLNDNPVIILKIAVPLESDAGTSFVRVGRKFINKLNASYGDVVEITGKRKTAGVLKESPAEDENKEIIRLDEVLQYNLDGNINDAVEVRKTGKIPAKKVFLSPAEPVTPSPSLIDFLKQSLSKKPVLKGSAVKVDVMGTDISFLVSNTLPNGIVIVDKDTIFLLSGKVAKDEFQMPAVTYKDLGGLSNEIETIREMIEVPINYPEVFGRMGIEPPKGVLIYGPPGTGKTMLVRAIANESNANFIKINGSEIMSKWFGESEKKLRDVFDDARKNAPALIFIDEIDSLAPKRDDYMVQLHESEKRIVSQLLTLMDGLSARGEIIVIGATNRPNALDPALRRPGRFDREIGIAAPNESGRKEIFAIHTKKMPLSGDLSIDALSFRTQGFVGADIAAVCRGAAMQALKRNMPEIRKSKESPLPGEILNKLVVEKKDFDYALASVEPSAMREVLIEIPNVKWDDIGGLDNVKEELKEMIEWPLKYSETFKKIGIKSSNGILLYGPPGCGKTLMAKAVANESEANFISISGPSLLSMWVGESERAVREIFKKARQVAPSIIFFDEIDSLAGSRTGGFYGEKVNANIVNTLLTEIDGVSELKNVVVMGATNRPDLIDTALLRPGRFGKLVFIPMPDEGSRKKIFEVCIKRMSIADDVEADEIISRTSKFSGADIKALCTEAGLFAVRENKLAEEVNMEHFKQALLKVRPSMSDYEIKYWEKLKDFRAVSRLGEEKASYR